MKILFTKLILFTFPLLSHAQWEQEVEILAPRENIYKLSPSEFKYTLEEGKKIALFYPVTVSDLLIPHRPLEKFFESDPTDPVRRVLFELARVVSPFKSMHEVYSWLGVHDFPKSEQHESPVPLPQLDERQKDLPMGATLIQTPDGEALTFGCAACHASDLFGIKVLGLTNRFPRANEFFRLGQTYAPYINTFLFRDLLHATEGERLMMARSKNAVKWVGTKKPAALGLDTSLAQVALSLSKRERDEYATRSATSYLFPRPNKLESMISDSKPAVWWNVKYKNRWLSDGSIVSGNPVHTNFLWNEIGRGTDLKKLEKWMKESQKEIDALTVAVFASRAPRYEKFFGEDALNIDMAKRGQKHFVQSCQKCHGTYVKGWDIPGTKSRTELVQNISVRYHKKTPVINVGTDPGRFLGMKEFADDLNRLKISRSMGTVVVPQKGYVPPPLEGIWARWPYFHNNSVPSLCALLTRSEKRPKTFWAGKAIDKDRDFDQECVGYPTGEKVPELWKQDSNYLYDTSKEGLSSAGHDEGIFLKDGKEIYRPEEKMELIEFLKTL